MIQCLLVAGQLRRDNKWIALGPSGAADASDPITSLVLLQTARQSQTKLRANIMTEVG